MTWRKTTQALAPVRPQPTEVGQYDLYPGFPIGSGEIEQGYEALADTLRRQHWVVLDGYGGVFWEDVRAKLEPHFARQGLATCWLCVDGALRPPRAVEALVEPFLSGDDPIFGTRFTGTLADFFDEEKLRALEPDADADLSIIYGAGAALAGWDAYTVYLDVPKNEVQFRSRAGRVTNLGASEPDDPKAMYKRFYFVDWPALNRHKRELLPKLDLLVDTQRPDAPLFMTGDSLRSALSDTSRTYFRVRPWFEPGAWGGQRIKEKVPQLPQDVPNYAWSFELITPENGLMLESDGKLLEVAFDLLMDHAHREVLGEAAGRFGYDFPIRFDFLDTFSGGNLSLQCHPRPAYIREHFGEPFTQDETYYILDCAPGAQVYLGFREDIDPDAFRKVLESSQRDGVEVDVPRYVQVHEAHKHDLFLIPSGTVHCSGVDNLVLEISATPYIFTFKMYDWLRLDLNGKPRPINIERAFENLHFERKGERAKRALLSEPRCLEKGEGWRVVHLPTHPEHFYDVHRLEFERNIEVETENRCLVMSLVEGSSIRLEVSGYMQRFNYAETFVVPAAAGRYRLVNEGDAPVKVVQAFVRPGAGP